MTKARLYRLVATGLIAAQALVAWAHGFNFNERGLAAGTFVVFSLLMLIVALPIRASLRDDLAAKAMQNVIGGGVPHTVEKDERDLTFAQWVAKNAHGFADTMLAARGEKK